VHSQLLDILPEFVLTLKEDGLHIVEDDLLMFVRSTSAACLVEKVGQVLVKLICVLSKTTALYFKRGSMYLTCNVCESGIFVSFLALF